MIGGADVNSANFEVLTVGAQFAFEGPVLTETVQEGRPGVLRGQMLNNEDCRRNVGGQLADELVERFQSPSGRSDHDDIPAVGWHNFANFILLSVCGWNA